jgi:hypothetical protein
MPAVLRIDGGCHNALAYDSFHVCMLGARRVLAGCKGGEFTPVGALYDTTDPNALVSAVAAGVAAGTVVDLTRMVTTLGYPRLDPNTGTARTEG